MEFFTFLKMTFPFSLMVIAIPLFYIADWLIDIADNKNNCMSYAELVIILALVIVLAGQLYLALYK